MIALRRASNLTQLLLATSFCVRALATSSTSKKAVTLITFDVDGTLIHGSSTAAEISAHARAFSYGVGSIFAEETLDAFQIQYPMPLKAIDPKWYHGSTDGLIALQFAKSACNVESTESIPRLKEVFQKMYEYCVQIPGELLHPYSMTHTPHTPLHLTSSIPVFTFS